MLFRSTVFAIYGGICAKLFTSAAYSCTQVSLADLVKVAFLAIMINQTIHGLFKPTQLYKLTHTPDPELTKGQGMVEYALILVLVAVVVIAALTIMGPLVNNVFSTINSGL